MATETSSGGETGGQRNIVLRPLDWSPWVAGGLVFVVVVVVVGSLMLVLYDAVTSPSTTPTTSAAPAVVLSPRLVKVTDCLAGVGLGYSTDGLDFVAENALGGAVKTRVYDNVVTITDGINPAGALGIVHGYRRLSRDSSIIRLVHRDGRFALLWQRVPSASQTAMVHRCLG